MSGTSSDKTKTSTEHKNEAPSYYSSYYDLYSDLYFYTICSQIFSDNELNNNDENMITYDIDINEYDKMKSKVKNDEYNPFKNKDIQVKADKIQDIYVINNENIKNIYENYENARNIKKNIKKRNAVLHNDLESQIGMSSNSLNFKITHDINNSDHHLQRNSQFKSKNTINYDELDHTILINENSDVSIENKIKNNNIDEVTLPGSQHNSKYKDLSTIHSKTHNKEKPKIVFPKNMQYYMQIDKNTIENINQNKKEFKPQLDSNYQQNTIFNVNNIKELLNYFISWFNSINFYKNLRYFINNSDKNLNNETDNYDIHQESFIIIPIKDNYMDVKKQNITYPILILNQKQNLEKITKTNLSLSSLPNTKVLSNILSSLINNTSTSHYRNNKNKPFEFNKDYFLNNSLKLATNTIDELNEITSTIEGEINGIVSSEMISRNNFYKKKSKKLQIERKKNSTRRPTNKRTALESKSNNLLDNSKLHFQSSSKIFKNNISSSSLSKTENGNIISDIFEVKFDKKLYSHYKKPSLVKNNLKNDKISKISSSPSSSSEIKHNIVTLLNSSSSFNPEKYYLKDSSYTIKRKQNESVQYYNNENFIDRNISSTIYYDIDYIDDGHGANDNDNNIKNRNDIMSNDSNKYNDFHIKYDNHHHHHYDQVSLNNSNTPNIKISTSLTSTNHIPIPISNFLYNDTFINNTTTNNNINIIDILKNTKNILTFLDHNVIDENIKEKNSKDAGVKKNHIENKWKSNKTTTLRKIQQKSNKLNKKPKKKIMYKRKQMKLKKQDEMNRIKYKMSRKKRSNQANGNKNQSNNFTDMKRTPQNEDKIYLKWLCKKLKARAELHTNGNGTHPDGTTIHPQQQPDSGYVALVVIAVLLIGFLILGLLSYFGYRHCSRRTLTSINFDNPVYRKTTEDQFSLEKNMPTRMYPSTVDDETIEPLTKTGTECV